MKEPRCFYLPKSAWQRQAAVYKLLGWDYEIVAIDSIVYGYLIDNRDWTAHNTGKCQCGCGTDLS